MGKGLKSFIGLLMMLLAVYVMVFYIFPAIDNGNKTEGNMEKIKNYSKYTAICTIPMGEGCDMYYDYNVYPFYCEGPSKYKIGLDGEIIIVDQVSNQILVYDGDNLRFKYMFGETEEIADIYCVEEGYVVNFYFKDEEYTKKAARHFDKNGNMMAKKEWYIPNEVNSDMKNIQEGVVGIIDAIEDEDGVAYAELLNKDEDGNYYIMESRTVSIDSYNKFLERYICKYNSEGERVAYAIYDYSGRYDKIYFNLRRTVIMDEQNNIYMVEFLKEGLIIYKVELGQDDEDMHDEHLTEYIDEIRHYQIFGEVDGVTWLDIKEENIQPENEEKFAHVTDKIRGYIMEVKDDEIIVERVYRVETYPYDVNDYYIQYSDEQFVYKFADDMEVWAYYQYPYQYGIIGAEDIENFEITEGYNDKIEWVIYLNEEGEVQYIFQPYVP